MDNEIVCPDKYTSFNMNDLSFSEPKPSYSGGQCVYVNYKQHSKLRIQSPPIYAPFGISTNKKGKKYIKLSLNDNSFKQFIAQIDDHVTSTGVSKSVDWFKKELSADAVKDMFVRSWEVGNPAYPPNMFMNYPTQNDEFTGEIYDVNNKEVSEKVIKEKTRLQVVVDLIGIYFKPKEMRLSWKLVQIKVLPPAPAKGFAFKLRNEEEDSDNEPA